MPQDKRQSVSRRQEPLRQQYLDDPDAAWICDRARAVVGGATDPFHGEVEPANNNGLRWTYGIHHAVGGDHDAPNPGDLLCSALATCLHATTRMLADWLGVEIIDVEVAVGAQVDVRGTLMVDPAVPVGFQRLHCDGRLEVPIGTDGQRLKALMTSAERCCVVMQTLRQGIEVTTDWHIDQDLDDASSETGSVETTTRKEVQS